MPMILIYIPLTMNTNKIEKLIALKFPFRNKRKKQQQQHTNGYLQAIFKTANTNDRIQA